LGAATDLGLPLGSTILQIAVIILIPVGIGMALHHYVPQFAAPLEKWVKWLALFFLGLIIAGLLLKERANVLDFFAQVGWVMLTLVVVTMALGTGWHWWVASIAPVRPPSPSKWASKMAR